MRQLFAQRICRASQAAAVFAVASYVYSSAVCHGAAIASWTFESYVPSGVASQYVGAIKPESGIGEGGGFHQSAVLWSAPPGNGSSKSLGSSNWAAGDYVEFYAPTLGYRDITVAWDQSRVGAGPSSFALMYSSDGTAFTQLGANVVAPVNPSWVSTLRDLSSIAMVENSEVYLRIVSLAAAAGEARFDNFVVSGTELPDEMDRFWTNPGNGVYSTASNWLDGIVPSDRDAARFQVGRASHIVSYSAAASSGAIYVTGDQVTLNLNNYAHVATADVRDSVYVTNNFTDFTSLLRVTDGVLAAQGARVGGAAGTLSTLEVVGAEARLNLADSFGELLVGSGGAGSFLADGMAEVRVGTAGVWIGGNPDSAVASLGVATVSNGAKVTSQGPVRMGDFGGTGELRIQSGGTLTTALTPVGGSQIGVESGGVNQVLVTGSGSRWDEAGSLSIGYFGSGVLTVSAQGVVSSVDGYVARFPDAGASSVAVVTGAGSQWNIVDELGVASDGSGSTGVGELRVAAGGRVSVGDKFITGTAAQVDVATGGQVTVGNATAISNTISIGSSGRFFGGGIVVGNIMNAGQTMLGPSIGALTVTGGFQQLTGGKLTLELAGTTAGSNFDQLNVGGQLSLAGTLEVQLAGGFAPAAGDVFGILGAWGSRAGVFSSVVLPSLSTGLTWNTSQLYTTGEIRVTSGTGFAAGDFDENGVVNGSDLAVWRANFGNASGANHTQGNADGDLDVDGADFLVWQRQVGSSGVVATSGAVPEPTTAVLFAVFAVGMAACRFPWARRFSLQARVR